MGMISPEWEEPSEWLEGPLTRTTLFLLDEGVHEATQRQNIVDQFNQLQPAMLLFLNKLKQIRIRFYGDDEHSVSSSVTLSISHPQEADRPILEKTQTNNGVSLYTRQKYHVTKGIAKGLPRNENREYTPQEEESRAFATGSVTLAFPLSEDDIPIIEPQDVFAFLPVRNVGFNVSSPYVIKSRLRYCSNPYM